MPDNNNSVAFRVGFAGIAKRFEDGVLGELAREIGEWILQDVETSLGLHGSARAWDYIARMQVGQRKRVGRSARQ